MMASLPPGQTMAMQQGPQAQYANGESHQEDTETDTPETGEALPPQYLPQSAQQPREPREQREGREQPREPREQQPQEAREQRGDREQGQPRGERGDRGDRGEGGHQDRRLNGRSRRVTDERAVNGNGRVITSLDGEDGQAPAPAQPQGEAQGDDSDEALA